MLIGVLMFLGIGTGINLCDYYVNGNIINNELTIEASTEIERDFINNFVGKYSFININGLVNDMIGQDEMNGVYKLPNEYMMTPLDKVTEEDLDYEISQIQKLNIYFEQKNIPFMYVLTPYVVSPYSNTNYVEGILDYGNQNMDYFINHIDDVACIDMRNEFYSLGLDQYEQFYRTDHHWNTLGGFEAYKIIIGKIEETLDVVVPNNVKEIENYHIENYLNWHLGSRGQRTGELYGGSDDFKLILPNFPRI